MALYTSTIDQAKLVLAEFGAYCLVCDERIAPGNGHEHNCTVCARIQLSPYRTTVKARAYHFLHGLHLCPAHYDYALNPNWCPGVWASILEPSKRVKIPSRQKCYKNKHCAYCHFPASAHLSWSGHGKHKGTNKAAGRRGKCEAAWECPRFQALPKRNRKDHGPRKDGV